MPPKDIRKQKKHQQDGDSYSHEKQAYLTGATPPDTNEHKLRDNNVSNDGDQVVADVRVSASEKRDILLYYILEKFYNIDEAHKTKLYAFFLYLMES
jgi:hypothetical protein